MVRATSRHCYYQIVDEGLLPLSRMEVYKWLFDNGPATASEVESGLNNIHAHKRLPELRDMGVVLELGTCKCKITGRDVIEWQVIDALPSDYVPSEPKRKTRKQLEAYVTQLEQENADLRVRLGQLKRVARRYKYQVDQLGLFDDKGSGA